MSESRRWSTPFARNPSVGFPKTQSTQKGSTKSVNIFPLNFNQFKIVDLPGYGFGGGSLEQGSRFQKLIRRYLSESSRVSAIFWCINARHGLNENDRLFLQFASNLQLPIHLVFTKADQMEQLMLFERIKAICQVIRPFARTFSSEVNITSTKTQFGLAQLRMAVKQALLESSPRSINRRAGRISYLLEEQPTAEERATYRLLVQSENLAQTKRNLLEMKGHSDDSQQD
jgi:GTP-binding protein